MEKMNSNELKNELMEVTGGAAETDLVPVKEKSSELIPKPDSETITCMLCRKNFNVPKYERISGVAMMGAILAGAALAAKEHKKIESCYVCPECVKKFRLAQFH